MECHGIGSWGGRAAWAVTPSCLGAIILVGVGANGNIICITRTTLIVLTIFYFIRNIAWTSSDAFIVLFATFCFIHPGVPGGGLPTANCGYFPLRVFARAGSQVQRNEKNNHHDASRGPLLPLATLRVEPLYQASSKAAAAAAAIWGFTVLAVGAAELLGLSHQFASSHW